MLVTAAASAEHRAPSPVAARPTIALADALRAIAARTHQVIRYDPEALAGLTVTRIPGGPDALRAVRAAVAPYHLSVERRVDGSVALTDEVTVVAQRDEAETDVLVRATSTSDRAGQSLREQPRNAEVIGARLIADRQDLTVIETLRHAGGVVSIGASPQAGANVAVRGFVAETMANGLAGGSALGVVAGTTGAVAAIERVEVLKGPVAILAGADHLGGAVNIVFKRPSTTPSWDVGLDTAPGPFHRLTLDVGGALTDDQRVSARFIASRSRAERNAGGYHGDAADLLLPELRYKTATTDVVVGLTEQHTRTATAPFAPVNPVTHRLYELRRDRPLLSPDQGSALDDSQWFATAEQKLGSAVDLVARYQHQRDGLALAYYTILAITDPRGEALVSSGRSRQHADRSALDDFVRVRLRTAALRHTVVIGYYRVADTVEGATASGDTLFHYDLLAPSGPPPPLAPVDRLSYRSSARQTGLYAQDLAAWGPLHVLAAVRRSRYATHGLHYGTLSRSVANRQDATTPSLGAVLDLTPTVSLFAHYVEGFRPTFTRDFAGAALPNTQTRDVEGGAKLDLAHGGVALQASYFDLYQSHVLMPDPAHRGYAISGPGQLGRGIDVNASGVMAPGLTLQASASRTLFSFSDATYGAIVPAAPRTQYSAYLLYQRALDASSIVGASFGAAGHARASVDRRGTFYVPATLNLDGNLLLRRRAYELNLGVRNILDRRNDGLSYSSTYVPYGEPRSLRLSLVFHLAPL